MAEEFGAVEMSRLTEYNEKGIETRKLDLTEPNKLWQHPWMLVHRVRLHDKLKQIATGNDGKGRPVDLHLASKVLEVDTENATITLEGGDKIQADLILGADGIYVSLLSLCGVVADDVYSPRPENLLLGIPASSLGREKLHSGSLFPESLLMKIPI